MDVASLTIMSVVTTVNAVTIAKDSDHAATEMIFFNDHYCTS